MKKIFVIFFSAIVLDSAWQNLQVFLYANYKGGPITEFILLRAVLFDVVAIVIIVLPFLFLPLLKNRSWLIIICGIMASILIEWWGLSTGRWAYSAFMPIIPILDIGLTPAVQLGLLGYISFRFSSWYN